jgi:hypothetical protein
VKYTKHGRKYRNIAKKDGEHYWRVRWDGFAIAAFRVTFLDSHDEDYLFKYAGNCFRTEAEAEKHKYEIYEKLTGKKWEEKCD